MAKNFNDGEDVIDMVKFDIQDHTGNPKTIFEYIPPEIPFQAFTWDTVEKKFSVNEEKELVKAIRDQR